MNAPPKKTPPKKTPPKKTPPKKTSPKKTTPKKGALKKSASGKNEEEKETLPKQKVVKFASSPKEKKKRQAPTHSELQTKVIKMICAKYNVKYPEGMKKLKMVMTEALGKPYAEAKEGGMTYMEALKITEKYLQNLKL